MIIKIRENVTYEYYHLQEYFISEFENNSKYLKIELFSNQIELSNSMNQVIKDSKVLYFNSKAIIPMMKF